MDLLDKADALLTAARNARVMVSTAESCTGGLIFATLTEIAGSSDVMDRGFITYSNDAKTRMLGVPATLIETHGAVSEAVGRAMAEGALQRSNADIAVAVTGIAGPGGSERKPEGRVCFAIARTGAPTRTETVEFGAIGRSNVRRETVRHAFGMLAKAISTKRP